MPDSFACPLCIDTLLSLKYKQKREAFEAEFARIETFLAGTNAKETRLRVLERIWTKERLADRAVLKGLGRECDGILEV